MKGMMSISPLQAMQLWEQLIRCLYNTNTYAGHVAEIYISSVMAHSNIFALSPTSKFVADDIEAAVELIYEVCKHFEEHFGVTLWYYANGYEAEPESLDDFRTEANHYRVWIGVRPEDVVVPQPVRDWSAEHQRARESAA